MASEGTWRGWMQLGLGFGLTLLFFYMMAPFLVALLLGAVTAILAYPLYDRLRRLVPPHLSALIVTLGVTLGIVLPFIFVLYNAAYRLLDLFGRLRLLTPNSSLDSLMFHPMISRVLGLISRWMPINRDWLRTQALGVLQEVVEKLSRITAGFLAGMPGLLLAFFIVILSAYFFLVDGAKFLRFLATLSPMPRERTALLYGAFEKSCRGVVLGLFASALVQGVLMAFFFIVTGLPSPFFIAIITAIMGMVPVVGSAPLWIGATLYLFLRGHPVYAILMLCGGILISTSDNIVRPWVMRGQSEMHPLLALVSVFGAVNLFGATGIFLGPIIAAVFVSFLSIVALEIGSDPGTIVIANPDDQPKP